VGGLTSEAPGNGMREQRTGDVEIFHVGDTVMVARTSLGAETPQLHTERIKEDGTITPPEVGPVVAAGRSAGDLQKELQEKYNKIYKNMTVTVTAGDRFYYLDGEINKKGPEPYLGETDIVKAISAAGGFTDFANKKKIRLIHPSGRTEIINYNKAVDDPTYYIPVYPGDKVFVPRRFL
jgi:polysaccharide export outer membrane protein